MKQNKSGLFYGKLSPEGLIDLLLTLENFIDINDSFEFNKLLIELQKLHKKVNEDL